VDRVQPGDTAGLVQLLRTLEKDRDLLTKAGARARSAFEQRYDKSVGVERVLSIMGVSKSSVLDPAPSIDFWNHRPG
jgi:hypothetical protein